MNYYEILGVSEDATPQAIKSAYRKLALETHPDLNPSDSDSHVNFARLTQAYSVLSDPDQRREYDEILRPKKAHTEFKAEPERTKTRSPRRDPRQVFLDEMEELASFWRDSGRTREEIQAALCKLGCSEDMAGYIVHAVFRYEPVSVNEAEKTELFMAWSRFVPSLLIVFLLLVFEVEMGPVMGLLILVGLPLTFLYALFRTVVYVFHKGFGN